MNTKLSFVLGLIASSIPGSLSAALIATDDFSSGNLSGGTGWSNNWSGGTVNGGALQQINGNPQNISRSFDTPTLTPGSIGTPAGFYSVQMNMTVSYNPNPPTQNHGIRITQDGPNNGTFNAVWKSDFNGGQLTFLTTNSATVTVPGPEWNIASTYGNNFSYTFTFDVTVLNGQNPGQYNGTYVVSEKKHETLAPHWRSAIG